jgi:hypothetical protein
MLREYDDLGPRSQMGIHSQSFRNIRSRIAQKLHIDCVLLLLPQRCEPSAAGPLVDDASIELQMRVEFVIDLPVMRLPPRVAEFLQQRAEQPGNSVCGQPRFAASAGSGDSEAVHDLSPFSASDRLPMGWIMPPACRLRIETAAENFRKMPKRY